MNQEEILKRVQSGDLDLDEAKKLLAQLEPPRRGTLYCKVSPKGAVSLYGLQRMPVTLYVEQWDRLLAFGDEIKSFAKANDKKLARKSS